MLFNLFIRRSCTFIFRNNTCLNLNKQNYKKNLLTKIIANNYSTSFKMSSSYSIVERGQPNTTNYRVYIKNDATNDIVSPFHDISLLQNKEKKIYNMVVEIPRWTNAKMEINKKEKMNPIVQDVKSNKLRFVNNVFPYHGYIWNYGALPQTFEDPNHLDETTGCKGDNDPLDVCEIGSQIHKRGSVVGVKVLGALGLIDEGEADWKIIAIDVTDPLAEQLNDIDDVERLLPGLLDATRDWFRIYKIPTGKPANNFAKDGYFFNREFAYKQIETDNASWKGLFKPEAKSDKYSLVNTTLDDTFALKVCGDESLRIVNTTSEQFNPSPAQVDTVAINTVHYVDRSKL